MRIAYLAILSSHQPGVIGKISAQIAMWQHAGCDVKLFVLTKTPELGATLSSAPLDQEVFASRLGYLTHYERLVDRLLAWQPELVYFRFASYLPGTARVMRRVPTVMELNSDDLQQNRLTAPLHVRARHRLTRGRLFKQAAGIVCVSADVAQRNAHFGRPTVVIGNGIKLGDYPQLAAPNNAAPRLTVLAGTAHPWIGLDKVIELARHCSDWRFDLVGDLEHALPSPLPDNVSMHGLLPRDQYEPILARTDVSLGALALHRYGLNRNSTLKVLEYLAYGIPTITAYEETHFPIPPWFLLQLPNREDNIVSAMDEIRQFVADMRSRRVPRDAIRGIDIEQTEEARLAFFRQVLAQRGG